MRKKDLTIDERIKEISAEIDRLNDECADKMSEVLGDVKSRILSFSKEQEVNKIVDHYTKKIARLVVEKEELEELLK